VKVNANYSNQKVNIASNKDLGILFFLFLYFSVLTGAFEDIEFACGIGKL